MVNLTIGGGNFKGISYVGALEYLYQNNMIKNINDLKWILDTKNIIKSFADIPMSSQKAYYATVLVFMYKFYFDNKTEQQEITNEIMSISNQMKAKMREQKIWIK